MIRERLGEAVFEAMFRYRGKQLKRRIGPAWLERDATGGWRQRRGRVPERFYDRRRARVAAAQIVSDYVTETTDVERVERERRARRVTFREVAAGYLRWLDDVRGAKPSTLADCRYLLAEPGIPAKRGRGQSAGHIMAALGDLPAAGVSVRLHARPASEQAEAFTRAFEPASLPMGRRVAW